MIDNNRLASDLAKVVEALPETISRDDLEHHPWLRVLILVSDDLSNRVSRFDLDMLKMGLIK